VAPDIFFFKRNFAAFPHEMAGTVMSARSQFKH